jgi:Hemerythrin HHE cation binding domain
MSDSSGTSPVAGIDAQILAEHRHIGDLAGQIDTTGELGDLLTRLAALRSALLPHFLVEEAADGFYDMIRSMAPRLLGRMDQLEREHQALLADIDALTARARACLAGPVAEVLADAHRLTRRLRNHEAAEDEILLDTMYTDLGQGD